MGKLYDSLLSGTSGRTGRIVVANVFGNEITRIRPKKRTSKPTADPKPDEKMCRIYAVLLRIRLQTLRTPQWDEVQLQPCYDQSDGKLYD